MNILVTTLGFSWHIVPEMLGFTNPAQFPLYQKDIEIEKARKKCDIKPVDECWVVTVGLSDKLSSEIDALRKWATCFSIKLRLISCNDIVDFTDENAIRRMRSCIYRVVLHASERIENGDLYLSLAGGRKTMSADMQEAANLFGCDLLLHVIDKGGIPNAMKTELNTAWSKEFFKYGKYFLPLVIKSNIRRNVLLDNGLFNITGERYPLLIDDEAVILSHAEDITLLEEIERRKEESDRVYQNFLSSLNMYEDRKRSSFRAMHLLSAEMIEALKTRIIGFHEESDIKILRSIPKCDLHSHLGGVLAPGEILEVANHDQSLIDTLLMNDGLAHWYESIRVLVLKQDLEGLYALKNKIHTGDKKTSFERNLLFLSALKDEQELFHNLVNYPYQDMQQQKGIGIEAYQKLGDFQGSLLLQTQTLIRATCKIYTENLLNDGVGYVEIRCSPYKYCEYGMSLSEVLDCIMDGMDDSGITYRLIVIMGRTSSKQEISSRVEELLEVCKTNSRFSSKFVGVDLAGTEGAQKPSELRECFLPLLRECIHITIHAGETESVENIWEAVYYLAADRIGHGLRLLEKPELMIRFVDKNIGVELCPSSNDQIIGYEKDYPLISYMNQGLKVTLNTDNCGISATSMSKEFFKAGSLCKGITVWDCLVLVRNSISVAFLDSDSKRALMIRFEKKIMQCIQEGVLV